VRSSQRGAGGPGTISPFPPHHGCGNIDNRHLVAGSTLRVPVHVPGALFSCGDPHAAQGDGEVSVTALEAPLSGSMRITLHKQRISAPRFRVPESSRAIRTGGYHARHHRDSFNWFLNGFIPVAGIIIDGYILYKGFFVTELALPFKTGSSIVWFSLAWAVLGIAWAWWCSRRRSLASISLASEV